MNRRRFGDRFGARTYPSLLIVTEGPIDKAFINHIKSIFCPRGSGMKVNVEAGSGGSPGNVITHAIRSFKTPDYSHRLILLDSDVPVNTGDRQRARYAGYTLIQWQPQCLEGALLQALGERVRDGESCQALKSRLHPSLCGAPTSANSYAQLFDESLLTTTDQPSLVQLRQAMMPNAE